MDVSPETPRRRAPAWDMAAISAISLWLAYWFIPVHISSSDALGLPPALLPTACALGMAGLAGTGFLLSFRQGISGLEMAGMPWRPVAGFIALCAIGVAIISYTSLSIGALYLIPVLMYRLGEHRWMLSVPAALIVATLIHFVVP